jgi:LysR family hydrogen peroxide-inducible transcriptional activator
MATAPTLAQLRALVALADHLHFGQAAEELGVSQPSVSAAISGLEASLGVELAERSSRRVVLTPVGQQAAARARRILAEVDHLVGSATGEAAPAQGPLRLGVIPTVAPYVLAPVLRALARRLPEVRLEVTEDQTARLLDELSEGLLDALVLALPTGAAGVVEVPLYWEDFVLLVPPEHSLAGKAGLSPAVLRDVRLLLLEEGHCLSGQVLDICRQAGAVADHPARAASLTTIAQLVAARLGTTLLPATALPVETRKGKLAVARFRPPAPGRRIGLVFRPDGPRALEHHQLAEYMRRALDRPGFAGRVSAGTVALGPVPGRKDGMPAIEEALGPAPWD